MDDGRSLKTAVYWRRMRWILALISASLEAAREASEEKISSSEVGGTPGILGMAQRPLQPRLEPQSSRP